MEKEFRYNFYYKILRSDKSSISMQYKIGINVLPDKYNINNPCQGIYFTTRENILHYINYGTIIAEIRIPYDAHVIEDSEQMSIHEPFINGWRSDKIIIINFYNISNYSDFLWFMSGKNKSIITKEFVKWALYNNSIIWNYLNDNYHDYCVDVIKTIEQRELDI